MLASTRRRRRSIHAGVNLGLPDTLAPRSATRVQWAGWGTGFFNTAAGTASGGATVGVTFITDTTGTGAADFSNRCRAKGYIRRVTVSISSAIGSTYRVMTLRPNGANYDVVGQSELLTSTAVGNNVHVLATPLPCIQGDVLGIWLAGGGTPTTAGLKTYSLHQVMQLAGLPASNATGLTFATTLSPASLNLLGEGTPPTVLTAGDSVLAGHDVFLSPAPVSGVPTGAYFQPYMGEQGTGDINADPMYRMVLNNALNTTYMNAAKGSLTFASTLLTLQSANGPGSIFPDALWIHCGVNDVSGGRTWAAMSADLDTIRALTAVPMVFDETLPWTSATDPQAAAIRSNNASLAAWVAAQSRPTYLNRCHDAFGVNRVSTGQLDNLNPIYDNGSGLHLSQAGVDLLARLAFAVLS